MEEFDIGLSGEVIVYWHIGDIGFIGCIGPIRSIGISAGSQHRSQRRYPLFGTFCAPTEHMTPRELRERTRQFTLGVIKFCRTLPSTTEGLELGRQLTRAGMGVSGNYRSAQRARSRTEFAARLGIVLDESDESEGWLAMACDLEIGDLSQAVNLRKEADELCAIFGRACQTARRSRGRSHKASIPR
jgi:four helix bundle protein